MVSDQGRPAAPRTIGACRRGASCWSRRAAASGTVRPDRSTPAALMPGLMRWTCPVAGTVRASRIAGSATSSARGRRDMAAEGTAASRARRNAPFIAGAGHGRVRRMAYEALLSEVRLGPAALRNRVVSTAHQTGLVHDHLPTDDLVAYHEARARGGVGAVFLEATAVHETGLLTAHTIRGYPPALAAAPPRGAAPAGPARPRTSGWARPSGPTARACSSSSCTPGASRSRARRGR